MEVLVNALPLSGARCDLPSARRDDGFEARDVLTSRNHELVPISFLGPHDLMCASCACAAWYRAGGPAWLELRARAAVRIQAAARRSLATMKTARLRCEKFCVMLQGHPADADEGLGIQQPLWAAYSACSMHQLESGDTYQEWAADKLCMYDMDAPADCFSLSGRGLLMALYFARRLTIEQLACLGV